MQAVLREAAQINATQGLGLAMVAIFEARAKGSMSLAAVPTGVVFSTSGLSIEASLVQEICGDSSGAGKSGFMYHIHNFWHHKRRISAYGAQCGPEFTGSHWDPTAACGPSSGNPVCSECFADLPYACSPHSFKWWNRNQYRPGNPEACELGDLSNMFGTLKVGKAKGGAILADRAWGIAQMSAHQGVVHDKERCKPEKPGFVRASSDQGSSLNQLGGKSIVVHCPADYKNAGARLVCAKLT